jgi:hypothetical protein
MWVQPRLAGAPSSLGSRVVALCSRRSVTGALDLARKRGVLDHFCARRKMRAMPPRPAQSLSLWCRRGVFFRPDQILHAAPQSGRKRRRYFSTGRRPCLWTGTSTGNVVRPGTGYPHKSIPNHHMLVAQANLLWVRQMSRRTGALNRIPSKVEGLDVRNPDARQLG